MTARIAAVAAVALAFPAAAEAVTRQVTPGGSTTDPSCTAKPCELEHAVEDVAQPGDEVLVGTGTHMLDAGPSPDTLRITSPIDVHGAVGGPRPVVRTNRPEAIAIDDPGAHVSDLEFDHFDETFRTIRVHAGVVERVYARAAHTANACEVGGPAGAAVIRDSVCWNQAGAAGAGGLNAGLDSPPRFGKLINVTAFGFNHGVLVRADSGSEMTVDAHNVIANATGFGSAMDARVTTQDEITPGDTATLNFTHSNYETTNLRGPGASVTPPGSGSNQTAEPILLDPAGGNFHQADGSPTIDAGATDPLLGFMDIDWEARIQGPAPDIGADEGGVPPFPLPPVSPVDFDVSAPVRQRVERLFVRITCDSGPCAFVARGKVTAKDGGGSSRSATRAAKSFRLRRATATVATGKTRKLRLRMDVANRRALEELMERGHEAKAKIKVSATDPAGNRASDRVRVTIKD